MVISFSNRKRMAFSTGSVFRPSGVKMIPYSVSTPKIRFCTVSHPVRPDHCSPSVIGRNARKLSPGPGFRPRRGGFLFDSAGFREVPGGGGDRG